MQRPLGGWAATALRQLGWAMATPTGAVRTWIVVTTVLLVVSRTKTSSKKNFKTLRGHVDTFAIWANGNPTESRKCDSTCRQTEIFSGKVSLRPPCKIKNENSDPRLGTVYTSLQCARRVPVGASVLASSRRPHEIRGQGERSPSSASQCAGRTPPHICRAGVTSLIDGAEIPDLKGRA